MGGVKNSMARKSKTKSGPEQSRSQKPAWSSGSATIARVASKQHVTPAKPLDKPTDMELWPTLGKPCVAEQTTTQPLDPRKRPAVAGEELTRQESPRIPQQQAPHGSWTAPPPQLMQERVVVPVVPAPHAPLATREAPLEKRKAESWSRDSTPSGSPTGSPPLSPCDPLRPGCRRVDGVIVSPEAVESPKRVLQRWVEAGRPAVAMYALLVSNAEFRAFKRAVEVQVRRFGAPVRKKTRADERPDENALIEPAVARALLEDLGRVDVGRTQHAGVQSLHAQCKVNAAVRCFQFGMILPPASVQVYPLSVV